MPFSRFFRLLISIAFFGCLSAGTACAQLSIASNYLEGTIRSAEDGAKIAAAVISNSTTHTTAVAGTDGSYRIYARKDDRIVATAPGFEPYFFTASGYNGGSTDIRLRVKADELSEVIVRPRYYQYQADSARRAGTYQRTLARQRTSTVMSPVSLIAERFNKRSRQIQRFQQEFNRWEDQRFIDVRYNAALVSQLTGLDGDSLAAFMNANPMPYDYARAAGDLELKMWVRERYRDWSKRPFVPAVKPEILADSIRVEVPETVSGP